jgi:hypothetical protein
LYSGKMAGGDAIMAVEEAGDGERKHIMAVTGPIDPADVDKHGLDGCCLASEHLFFDP